MKEYLDATVPEMAFGEFWDTCEYADGVLNYNQDAHRQRTVNWCDRTGGTASAFDFTTKGAAQGLLPRGFDYGAQHPDRALTEAERVHGIACVQLVLCIAGKESAALSCRSVQTHKTDDMLEGVRHALSDPHSSTEHQHGLRASVLVMKLGLQSSAAADADAGVGRTGRRHPAGGHEPRGVLAPGGQPGAAARPARHVAQPRHNLHRGAPLPVCNARAL